MSHMSVTDFPDDYSKNVPPDTISNSVVKLLSADDSVGSPHVKVGHRQGFKSQTTPKIIILGVFCFYSLFIFFSFITLLSFYLDKQEHSFVLLLYFFLILFTALHSF